VRLLTAEFVTVESDTAVSQELVRRTLKKRAQAVAEAVLVYSPKQSAAFVWHMEDVLDVYTRPYDSPSPQICLDETHTQLLADVRPPLPCTPASQRTDPEYARSGVANLFLVCEPLRGWRRRELDN